MAVTVYSLVKGYGPGFPTLEELFGLEPDEESELRLSQPTPALGRYFDDVAFMQNVTSQREVGQLRFQVLLRRFIALNDELSRYEGMHRDQKVVAALSAEDKAELLQLATGSADILRAERLERFTEHDTAAAGDWLKILIGTRFPHLESRIEGVAFADTSEDTMSPVFGLIANKLVFGHFIPHLLRFMERQLDFLNMVEADGPLVLPGLTHQQAGEPTTFGKKVVTNLTAIDHHLQRLMVAGHFVPFSGRLGGAMGNLTTHYAAYPDIDWLDFARRFVEGLGLTYQEMTFQSVTYCLEASHFTELAHMMTHIIKLTEDFMLLASYPGNMFVKRRRQGAKGSSIMSNKSNPWGIEGANAMLRKSRKALLNLALELPSFPHEGNMARSFLMRDIGSDLMYAFIALNRISREMVGDMRTSGYIPNYGRIAVLLAENPAIASSSILTVLKRCGIEGDAYRQTQTIAFNPDGTFANAEQFTLGLEGVVGQNALPHAIGLELYRLVSPGNNIGQADVLAKKWSEALRMRIEGYRNLLVSMPGI